MGGARIGGMGGRERGRRWGWGGAGIQGGLGSGGAGSEGEDGGGAAPGVGEKVGAGQEESLVPALAPSIRFFRSEEHTSELQSR